MNECMHGLTVVCVCVCVCVCGWVVRSTCLQGGAVYIIKEKEPLRIAISLQIVQAV